MDSTKDALQLIAQPKDDQTGERRYVLWATTYYSHGEPLSEALPREYRSVTELRDFIVTICTPDDLLMFDFELLYDQLSLGQRYYAEITQSLAQKLGFIVSPKAALAKDRRVFLRDNNAVAS